MLTDLYNRCVKREPFIWVRRLVVLDRCDHEPVFIRDITFSRGLNILWAEEPEEDEVTTPIAGHSAGKTTFCRFFRYILGETTYANQRNAKLIREAFVHGYVAAELYVDGNLWAVRRPIGTGRLSYVAPDATIEQLLQDGGLAVSQDKYTERIGIEALMDRFQAGDVARSGEPIQWGHILAWMTRDQEARFQSVHDWRSPRSGSQTPSFRYPRSGALFVMRAALGLFRPEELSGEEQLTRLSQDYEQLEKEIQEKRREPQFRANLRILQLRKALRAVFADDNSIDSLPVHTGDILPDLLTCATAATVQLLHTVREQENEERATQEELDRKNAELGDSRRLLRQLEAAQSQAGDLGVQVGAGLSERKEQRQRLAENQDAECDMAQILIKDCTHVQDIFAKLDPSTVKDAHELEQLEARAEQQRRRLNERVRDLQALTGSLENDVQALTEHRPDIQRKRTAAGQQMTTIGELQSALEVWVTNPVSSEEFNDLCNAEKELADKQQEIIQQEKRLAELIKGHQVNRDLLANIFSMCVRAVISAPGYDGVVDFADRELHFQLVRGTAMSGEAVETLSILLADVSSVLFNCLSMDANLPGFLLHDSPREADLGLRLYHAFVNFIAELEARFGGPHTCPFQYILTTTSPPPRKLRESPARKDRFSAQSEEDLFLRRDISAAIPPPETPDLFADGGKV